MQAEKGIQTTATFFTEARPKTSHVVRNKTLLRQQFSLDPEIDPSARLKGVKEELRKLQGDYLAMVTRVNDSRKVIDQQHRHSQQRKVQFLNLYEHRRQKGVQQHQQQQQKQERANNSQGLRARTKSMKLNGEVRALLLRNEIDENNSARCTRNRLAKQQQQQQLQGQRERQLGAARSSFCQIKSGQRELQEKMRRIGEMQGAISRSNYARKLREEVGVVERLDRMLNEVCADELCEDCLPPTSFLTQKDPDMRQ